MAKLKTVMINFCSEMLIHNKRLGLLEFIFVLQMSFLKGKITS